MESESAEKDEVQLGLASPEPIPNPRDHAYLWTLGALVAIALGVVFALAGQTRVICHGPRRSPLRDLQSARSSLRDASASAEKVQGLLSSAFDAARDDPSAALNWAAFDDLLAIDIPYLRWQVPYLSGPARADLLAYAFEVRQLWTELGALARMTHGPRARETLERTRREPPRYGIVLEQEWEGAPFRAGVVLIDGEPDEDGTRIFAIRTPPAGESAGFGPFPASEIPHLCAPPCRVIPVDAEASPALDTRGAFDHFIERVDRIAALARTLLERHARLAKAIENAIDHLESDGNW